MELDKIILEYIKNNPTDNYENVFRVDKRWEVFYHLSQMRTSLLNWYGFQENSTILELGSGFGSITGLLCRKCGKVIAFEKSEIQAEGIRTRYKNHKNLEVISGEWDDSFFANKKFDYVFLNGEVFWDKGILPEEEYIKWIRRAKSLLKEEGILLLAAENRYGIRYFCGEIEPRTGIPFAGINKGAQSAGYFFSRSQLIRYIFEAGFADYKFYYPMPNNQFPQLIYSDIYLPRKDICERLVFYYRNKESLVASERELYADILDNQMFPFLTNSFLMECGKRENFSKIVYAAVSTDRGREHSFATVICDGDIVKKSALYPEGKINEERIFLNLMDIQAHGLNIVPHKKEQGALSMPYVQSVTCSDYLRQLVLKGDKATFIQLLDKLYKQILQSSEHEDKNQSEFPIKIGEQRNLGVILKRAYIDMVPFNCFYQNEEFFFFDQEFVREHYPAAYTMFRALKYTYLSIPEAERLVLLETLKERYELQENWDIFSEEEDRFVGDNRRYDVYDGFYSWTGIDQDKIKANGRKLSSLQAQP